MSPAQVFALEIKQYIGGDNIRTLVPKVIGETKPPPPDRWESRKFLAHLANKVDPQACKTTIKILDWIEESFPASTWGSGKTGGSHSAGLVCGKTRYSPFNLWSRGSIQIKFGHLSKHAPFDDPPLRRQFAGTLNEISGVAIPLGELKGPGFFDISLLNFEAERAKFFAAMEWLKQEVQSVS